MTGPEPLTHWDLLPDDEMTFVPVDPRPTKAAGGAVLGGQRLPVLPPWARDPDEFAAAARWATSWIAHATAFHTVRIPVYGGRLAGRSPRGAVRVVGRVWRWVTDAESAELRGKADERTYVAIAGIHDTRVKTRLWGVGIGTVVLTAGSVAGWLLSTPLEHWLGVAATVGALGLAGRQQDKPLLSRAVVVTRPQRLTAEIVVRGLVSLGGDIAAAVKKSPGAISFPAPISRDGPGWLATIDLPHGVTATEVMEKRAELASGLRRPLGCVWPESDASTHPGRLLLWVGDADLSRAKPIPWPLVDRGTVDLFEPILFGLDPRGRQVFLTLMFASMVIGSVPRMGKTFSARLLLLAAALHVTAELHAYDLKGTGDFQVAEPVCHRYRAGDDEEDIEYALADLRELRTEMRRRTKVIRGLPRALCPESKVTPQIAAMRELRMHPIFIVVDECQRWFEHKEHGEELESIAEDLVRRGPALGIIAVFATQRPDVKSLPAGISSNAIVRFCLKVVGHIPNDMVLGTGAFKSGIKATMFSRKDLGIGWLSGEEDEPQIVRTCYVDNPTSERVIARAVELRRAAGTLPAEDDREPAATYDLFADLADCWPGGDEVWSERLVAALVELRPDVYAGWTTDQLAKAVTPLKTRQIWDGEQKANRRGLARDEVVEMATQRRLTRSGGDAR